MPSSFAQQSGFTHTCQVRIIEPGLFTYQASSSRKVDTPHSQRVCISAKHCSGDLVYRIAFKHGLNLDSASVRIRCLNVIQHFRSPLVSLELFHRRDLQLYDAVIFSKLYSEECINEAQSLKARGKKVIFDICDNHFYSDTTSDERTQKLCRLKEMISLADYVTVSSEALKLALLTQCNASNITVIADALEDNVIGSATFIELAKASLSRLFYEYNIRSKYHGRTRLIWFGANGNSRSAGGGIATLGKLKDILHSHDLRDRIVLTICTRGRNDFSQVFHGWDVPVIFIRWSRVTFYQILQFNDIAVLPININPFTLCKTNNRVITALHNNLAVIADEIPSYTEFKDAIILNDWDAGLRQLIAKPALRATMVERGKDIIASKYTIASVVETWRTFLESVAVSQEVGE